MIGCKLYQSLIGSRIRAFDWYQKSVTIYLFKSRSGRYYWVYHRQCLTCLRGNRCQVGCSHVDYRWWSTDVEVRTPHVRTPRSLPTRPPSDSRTTITQKLKATVLLRVSYVTALCDSSLNFGSRHWAQSYTVVTCELQNLLAVVERPSKNSFLQPVSMERLRQCKIILHLTHVCVRNLTSFSR